MALGLTSDEIKQILNKDTLECLCNEYDAQSEGLPHVSGALALRELVIKLTVENNKRIDRQLSSLDY